MNNRFHPKALRDINFVLVNAILNDNRSFTNVLTCNEPRHHATADLRPTHQPRLSRGFKFVAFRGRHAEQWHHPHSAGGSIIGWPYSKKTWPRAFFTITRRMAPKSGFQTTCITPPRVLYTVLDPGGQSVIGRSRLLWLPAKRLKMCSPNHRQTLR